MNGNFGKPLLKRANGNFGFFVNDDDLPSTDYDFIMTVGKPDAAGYYGFSADNYGSVDSREWGNSETAEIRIAVVRPSAPYFEFRCSEMEAWNDYVNVRLSFFTETERVETTVSNGFLFTESLATYRWYDTQDEVSAFLQNNYGNDVFVKVIDASLEINNSIEMIIGQYAGGSSYSVWGYRPESNTGEMISGKYHSNSAIKNFYARDDYYGMALKSSVDNEYWLGWEYVNAKWEFEDGTSHTYKGRLIMNEIQGAYTSSVIDEELNTLAQNNIDKLAIVTLSQAETPSNVIEIEIGEVEIVADDIAYGLRFKSATGALISGEFPDASPVSSAYVRTNTYGCVIGGTFERTYWNYLDEINVTWEFEDGTSYEFPELLEYYYSSSAKESFYKSDYIDDTLVSIISSKVGQTAKIIVREVEPSKLLAHLQRELNEEAKP
ncbi:hypothetical protein MW334_003534 [Vibrio parahaemolyticus]|nr:hypothetical protein [Vibrio parahaemolyticus]EJB8408347.1 hypothetical protein [Vibrio parahaemolyticus]ELA9712809.1 hypothetical protein [Vibrio parahaemolyticus]ELA9726317.1 hypothetical protein [Vibrio parahaemolyticus]